MNFIFTYAFTLRISCISCISLSMSVTFMCKSTKRNVKFNILEFETRKTEHRYRFVMQRQGAWPKLKTRDHEWKGKPASVVNSVKRLHSNTTFRPVLRRSVNRSNMYSERFWMENLFQRDYNQPMLSIYVVRNWH